MCVKYNLPLALAKLTNMSNFITMRFWDVLKSKFDVYAMSAIYAMVAYMTDLHQNAKSQMDVGYMKWTSGI